MGYQVLARKWRPRSFREMVGQGHVLKALINALDSQRLHHAYLFTGTRGVGKTTIARIMAKCLNCEQGVSSSPCGTCSICREVDEGRFVDLIEVDAASKTKVEDTRELLDNVQYMPSRGRYKVYLIDEVHMLSTSSFNALLKTLEEPPPHVKFLLATTDPQKLPPTVLSRCLQFSLKNMPPESIVGHLSQVLASEQVPFEEPALWLLGRAADGSMRDAMSLTDQAVSFGQGKVLVEDVRAMLGTLDQGQVFGLLEALLAGDAAAMLDAIRHLSEQGPDWQAVLAELLNVLHRVAVAQVYQDAINNSQGDKEQIQQLAQAMPAEDCQFYYQLALLGRRDLPLAPDPRDGFEMVMLRMLAFRPAGLPGAPVSQPVVKQPAPATNQPETLVSVSAATPVAAQADIKQSVQQPSVIGQPAAEAAEQPARPSVVATTPIAEPDTQSSEPDVPSVTPVVEPAEPEKQAAAQQVPPWEEAPDKNAEDNDLDTPDDSDAEILAAEEEQLQADYSYQDYIQGQDAVKQHLDASHDLKPQIPAASGPAARWIQLYPQLELTGMTANIARNCSLVSEESGRWLLRLDHEQSALFNQMQQERINQAINKALGQQIELQIEITPMTVETPALHLARQRAQQQLDAQQSIAQDPLIQALQHSLSAEVCAGSVKPLNPI